MAKVIKSKSNVSIGKLQKEIEDNLNISSVCNFINKTNDDIEFDFNQDLSASEDLELDSILSLHVEAKVPFENFYVKEYDSLNRIVKEIWYENDDENGVYSKKAKEIIYSWSNNTLISRTEKEFWSDGIEISSNVYEYYSDNSQNKKIQKKKG